MESTSTEIEDYYAHDLDVCKSQDKIKNFYEHCQTHYDSVVHSQTTISDIHDYGANLLKEFLVDESCLILDVGCGVGDVGTSLRKSGFLSFHGTDPSANNIQILREKNTYSKLYDVFQQVDGRLDCPDDSYDGLISMSNNIFDVQFTIKTAIHEFCRIVRPAGYVMFTFDDNSSDPRDLMTALGDAMYKRKIDITLMEKQEYMTDNGILASCYCCVVKVLNKLYL